MFNNLNEKFKKVWDYIFIKVDVIKPLKIKNPLHPINSSSLREETPNIIKDEAPKLMTESPFKEKAKRKDGNEHILYVNTSPKNILTASIMSNIELKLNKIRKRVDCFSFYGGSVGEESLKQDMYDLLIEQERLMNQFNSSIEDVIAFGDSKEVKNKEDEEEKIVEDSKGSKLFYLSDDTPHVEGTNPSTKPFLILSEYSQYGKKVNEVKLMSVFHNTLYGNDYHVFLDFINYTSNATNLIMNLGCLSASTYEPIIDRMTELQLTNEPKVKDVYNKINRINDMIELETFELEYIDGTLNIIAIYKSKNDIHSELDFLNMDLFKHNDFNTLIGNAYVTNFTKAVKSFQPEHQNFN